jgi:putative transposase
LLIDGRGEMSYFHVWFSTKRRKWLLQGEIAISVKQLIWETAEQKEIALVECEAMVDHFHLLVECEDDELPSVVKALKGRSSFELFLAIPELKIDAATNSLWQRGYNRRELAVVARYIRTQDQRLEKYER